MTGFEDVSALLRIDWSDGSWTEVGRLPARIDGGVWLEPGRRLAVNVLGPSGRASVYAVDLEAGRFSLFFELSADSDDRAVLFDSETQHLVVTTDALGWPAVGIAKLGPGVRGAPDDTGAGVRFLAALTEGDEGGRPCGFVGPAEARQLLLHHETGPFVRLRTADLETLAISDPLPVPDGEVSRVVATDEATVRFAFSAPDLPWSPARLHLTSGHFQIDLEPTADGAEHAAPALRAGRPVPSRACRPDACFAP